MDVAGKIQGCQPLVILLTGHRLRRGSILRCGARPHISIGVQEANVIPGITMTALDADVIKTYVEAGVGIGIIAPMAFDAAKDTALRIIDCAKVFPPSTTSIAIRRGRLQRNYIYRFIEMCASTLTEDVIRDAESGLKENV